jgi:chaperone modulatory protein CbpM
MNHDEALIGTLLDESWMTVEQLAAACAVDTAWLVNRIDEGLLPGAESVGGTWRVSSRSLIRVRRMRQIERDFDAVPELAALVSDMLDELDSLRLEIRRYRR